MITKNEIDSKYLDQHTYLEAEFFDVVDEGLSSQHRVLKEGKSIDEFDQRHGEIWKAHETELIAEAFMEAPQPPKPARDLAVELDDLKARLERLEKK